MKKEGQSSKKISQRTSLPFDHHDLLDSYLGFIKACTGGTPFIEADGKIHRFDDPSGKPGNKACWYLLHQDGPPCGLVGNWRTGERWKWQPDKPGGRYALQNAVSRSSALAASRQRQLDGQRRQLSAQQQATSLWEASSAAAADHPYLTRKSVSPGHLRCKGSALLAPMIDTSNNLWNLQIIRADGAKRFLKGGRICGLFSLIGSHSVPANGRLYLCEGIATALTIHKSTGKPVAAAMTAGNLKPAAGELYKRYPGLELVVAADNDHRTPGNPGIRHAFDAARTVSCGVVWPRSCGTDCTCTDFNDVANCGVGEGWS
jgi:putative DNA primase/helicase